MYISFRILSVNFSAATKNEYLIEKLIEPKDNELICAKGFRLRYKKYVYISNKGLFIYNNEELGLLHWKTKEPIWKYLIEDAA
jgi:hypothetical protein